MLRGDKISVKQPKDGKDSGQPPKARRKSWNHSLSEPPAESNPADSLNSD